MATRSRCRSPWTSGFSCPARSPDSIRSWPGRSTTTTRPEPEDADPRLDFTAGALLVPVERWNEHAELEPNLGPCRPARTGACLFAPSLRTFDAPDGASSAAAARALGLAAVAARAT